MAEKKTAGLSPDGSLPLYLPSLERWQRAGRGFERRLRPPLVVRRLRARTGLSRWVSLASDADETEGPAAVAGHRWLRVAQALLAHIGAPANTSPPGLWPPRLRLDLPFLASWAWLPWRKTSAAAGSEPAARMGVAGRAAAEDGLLPSGAEAASTKTSTAASLPSRAARATLSLDAAAGLRRWQKGKEGLTAVEAPEIRMQDISSPAVALRMSPSVDASRAPALIRTVAERTPYTAPDERLRQFLSGILRLPLPVVRLHVGPAADVAVRALGADAVTYGGDILLREGAWQGDRRRGLALVAHEMAHAGLANDQPQEGPAPFVGSEPEEERVAQAGERHVLHILNRAPALPGLDMPTLAAAPAAPASAPGAQPTSLRTAPAGRDATGLPPVPPPPPAALTEQQLRIIKDAVYRDLMNRLRLEHERGG